MEPINENVYVLEPRVCKQHGLNLRPRQRNCDQCNREANKKYWASLKSDAALGAEFRLALGKHRWSPKVVAKALNTDYRDKGYVYFIQADKGDEIKIGWSKDPMKRLKTLQTAATKELHLLAIMEGGMELEYEIHQRFSKHRTVGEWFKPASEVIELAYLHSTMAGAQRLAI